MVHPDNLVGSAVRRLRIARGLTQRELAAPRYTAQYVSLLESGRVRPSQMAVSYIAERLGVSVGSLFDGDPRAVSLDVQRLIAAEDALTAAAAALRELRLSLADPDRPADTNRPPPAGTSHRRGRVKRTAQPREASAQQQPPLQVVIRDVLQAAGEPLPAATIAERVMATGWTPPRSTRAFRVNQIYARTTHAKYRSLFTRKDRLIGLAEWARG